MTPPPFSVLRQFMRPRPPAERCDLCSAVLPSQHQHLLEVAPRRLLCSCDPCAILFSAQEGARFRRVPQLLEALDDFRLSDALWEGLRIPINMAFFCRTAAGNVQAYYPSPAGATESLLPLETWRELEE